MTTSAFTGTYLVELPATGLLAHNNFRLARHPGAFAPQGYCSRMVIPGVTPEDASCIMRAFVEETM